MCIRDRETAAAKPDTGAQEVRADAPVDTARMRNLVYIRARRLTDGTDGVDRRDALREQRVGRLGQHTHHVPAW